MTPFAVLAVFVLMRSTVLTVAVLLYPWSVNPNRFIPAWAQMAQSLLFGGIAVFLLVYGRADRRAWALGLFMLDASGTLVEPFARYIQSPTALLRVVLHLRTDAFQAAMLWFFASAFPRPTEGRQLARAFQVGTILTLGLGVLLVALDTIARYDAAGSTNWIARLAESMQRASPSSRDWFFTVQFVAMLPLLALIPVKLREAGPNDRRRFQWLAWGLVIGLLPLGAEVVLGTVWTGYFALIPPRTEGAIIVLALTAVPVASAYAALVQRTLNVRIALRTALQYLLARWFIRAMLALPLAGIAMLIVVNRERSLVDLIKGPPGRSFALLLLGVGGAAAGRRRILDAIDRRFFREVLDTKATLLAVVDAAREATSIAGLHTTMAQAIERAFHPVTLSMAVTDPDRQWHEVQGNHTPFPSASPLGQLLSRSDVPLDVDGHGAASILSRIAEADRQWIDALKPALVVPLRAANGTLAGLIALGEKKSELPYGPEDRTLLSAVGSACGLALDRIHRTHEPRELDRSDDPVGLECADCGAIAPPGTPVCQCGGSLRQALAPHTLGDRLLFLQRIGSGATSVVYRALDLRLQQIRAVKTMPVADPHVVADFRREAQVMASVKHFNLATLYGLEMWRAAPMLVMEYLEGLTLADRLRHGPVPLAEALRMGADVTDGLAVLHAAGILHRDIKPSNIGFTMGGIPKLLDFGLAKLMTPAISSTTIGAAMGSTHSQQTTEPGGIRGTPAYLCPEVLRGESPRVQHDLWSLAVTMLEASMGSNPYRAQTVATTVARILTETRVIQDSTRLLPEDARQLFAELLGPEDARPQTALDFGFRLRQYLQRSGESSHGKKA